MIATASVMTDLVLSSAALIGLCVVHSVLRENSANDPLTRRFVFALRVAMLLFAGRASIVLTGGMWFRSIVLFAAALVPLAAVITAEGLLRRHAPKGVKWGVGLATVVFAVTAFWFGSAPNLVHLVGLMSFQVAGFAIAGWMIATRDRSTLSMVENRNAGRLAWSLVILVPLIATDFLLVIIRLPVQMSAIGVLVMCWVAAGLARGTQSHRAGFAPIGVVVFAGITSGALIAVLAGAGADGAILGAAISTSVMLVLAIIFETRASSLSAQSTGLIAHMAQAPTDSPLAFLRGLQTHPMVAGAVVVSSADLDGFDPDILTRIFTAAPVLRQAAPPIIDAQATDYVTHLFKRFGATHILDLGQSPRQLLALAMPALQSRPAAEVELDAVQRMASLIAKGAADAQ